MAYPADPAGLSLRLLSPSFLGNWAGAVERLGEGGECRIGLSVVALLLMPLSV